jgi:hypothetical protein
LLLPSIWVAFTISSLIGNILVPSVQSIVIAPIIGWVVWIRLTIKVVSTIFSLLVVNPGFLLASVYAIIIWATLVAITILIVSSFFALRNP